jgi:EAL domain-containing protein (putative c-di-GMP-specific phosphodiesterase class I)
VAVNLSSQQFLQSRVDEVVLQALFEASLKPRLLQLELTESILMHDMSETVPLLNKLKGMGIGLAMDDFGTGYSSLSYLKRLPIDAVKIDRTFVADLEQDRDDAAICATIIAMAHALGLQVIAEGVETEGQLEYLRAQGCDQAQGYLISKPVAAAELELEFLARGARYRASRSK